MTTLQVDILNPKAGKLLENLAELKLISIRNASDDGFLKLVNKFRAKAKNNPPSIEEISKEVENCKSKKICVACIRQCIKNCKYNTFNCQLQSWLAFYQQLAFKVRCRLKYTYRLF